MPDGEPKKRVLVELVFRHTIEVPEDWDDDQVQFWLTESCHCIGNDLRDILGEYGCGCRALKSATVVHKDAKP